MIADPTPVRGLVVRDAPPARGDDRRSVPPPIIGRYGRERVVGSRVAIGGEVDEDVTGIGHRRGDGAAFTAQRGDEPPLRAFPVGQVEIRRIDDTRR